MGNLLGSPITEKDTHEGQTPDGIIQYGISSMQGWRIHMEDAHIAQPFLYAEKLVVASKDASKDASNGAKSPEKKTVGEGATSKNDASNTSTPSYQRIPLPNHSLYAVFDGHGGSFAAEYSSRNLLRVLCRQPAFVRYAERLRDREKYLERLKSKSDKNAADADENTDENATTAGEEKTEDSIKEEDTSNSNALEKAAASYDHDLMNLLEYSLRDAFCDIDAEILREVRGDGNVDANMPYGEGYNLGIEGGKKVSVGVGHLPLEHGASEESEGAASGDVEKGESAAASPTKTNSSPANKSSAIADPPSPSDDEDSGTTAAVVLLTPRWIICANAGDSRAVLARSIHVADTNSNNGSNANTTAGAGTAENSGPSNASNANNNASAPSSNTHHAIPLSYDHKPDDEEEERRIREAGGYVSGGRVEGDLAVSRGLGDFRFKDLEAVLSGSWGENRDVVRVAMGGDEGKTAEDGSGGEGAEGGEGGDLSNAPSMASMGSFRIPNPNNPNKNEDSNVPMLKPGDQKVSPVPDIIVQNRDEKEDEFIIIACDGIWDVQTNQECVTTVAEIFKEGENNMGLVCEEVLDLCLIKGSKDNMTAAVIKFPKQSIGTGGGVTARRERRGIEGGEDGLSSQQQPQVLRVYSPYVPDQVEGEEKGSGA